MTYAQAVDTMKTDMAVIREQIADATAALLDVVPQSKTEADNIGECLNELNTLAGRVVKLEARSAS